MAEDARTVVSRDGLERIMNAALKDYDVCEDCVFDGGIMELREPDDDGCNWSDNVSIRCSGRSMTTHCLRAVLTVFEATRKHYNIESTV